MMHLSKLETYSSQVPRERLDPSAGFHHLVHLHVSLFWILSFALASAMAAKLILNSWYRYDENPTVITIQNDYREWNVTFPAVTLCFINQLDEKKAAQFIRKTWNITSDVDRYYSEYEEENALDNELAIYDDYLDGEGENTNVTTTERIKTDADLQNEAKFEYYLNFLRELTNSSYFNFDKLGKYLQDESVRNLDVSDSIYQVTKDINHKTTYFDKQFEWYEYQLIPSEMGMCYTYGSVISDYLLHGNSMKKHNETPKCNIHTVCYGRTEALPRTIKYYVHSPYELADLLSVPYYVQGRMERDTTFTALETVVSPEIYQISPERRGCRFLNEPTPNLSYLKVYSFNLCRMQCRKELARKLCGCSPYYYSEQDDIASCGIDGLYCLTRHAEWLIKLTKGGRNVDCECLPSCTDVKYLRSNEVVRRWVFPVSYDVRFRWGMEKFSKIRFQRDVVFSFEDLLVSLGGTAALFLGSSVMTFLEVAYFATLRLFFYILGIFQNA